MEGGDGGGYASLTAAHGINGQTSHCRLIILTFLCLPPRRRRLRRSAGKAREGAVGVPRSVRSIDAGRKELTSETGDREKLGAANSNNRALVPRPETQKTSKSRVVSQNMVNISSINATGLDMGQRREGESANRGTRLRALNEKGGNAPMNHAQAMSPVGGDEDVGVSHRLSIRVKVRVGVGCAARGSLIVFEAEAREAAGDDQAQVRAPLFLARRSKQTRLRGRGTLQAQMADGRPQMSRQADKEGSTSKVVKAKQGQSPPPSMFLFLLGVALLSMGPVSDCPFSLCSVPVFERGGGYSAGGGEEGNGPSPVAEPRYQGRKRERLPQEWQRQRGASLTVAWKLAVSRRGAAEDCVVRV
ncbi:hypothetical protein CPLU01_11792 [Colletotrichum plurivorum]|uniref:Uncharacterized protein n=1 Tax=Colletotrichum plurivorum TaxID=2175906 RepID=A0A8H6K1P4_9PEZI|nr:hypothetical protein CPLU01_11792 [Colletotrichum plurivorum]